MFSPLLKEWVSEFFHFSLILFTLLNIMCVLVVINSSSTYYMSMVFCGSENSNHYEYCAQFTRMCAVHLNVCGSFVSCRLLGG